MRQPQMAASFQRLKLERLLSKGMVLGTVLLGSGSAWAGTVVVTQFDPLGPSTPLTDRWYTSDVRPGGTATIVDLTGMGGNLESSQPLPTGAARLTTDSTTAAKAEVATFADFGLASEVLANVALGYSYYKSAGPELFAAPSIKLTILGQNHSLANDNYGTLVYEPYWQGSVPAGSWQSVAIDSSTGGGSTANGGWWWNGGFGQSSGAGGPPIRSLSEWLTAFQASDPTDFASAHVIALSMGVGTYNVNQDDYFDAVHIQTGAIDKTYDFQTGSVPEAGSSLALLGGAFALIGAAGRKRRG